MKRGGIYPTQEHFRSVENVAAHKDVKYTS